MSEFKQLTDDELEQVTGGVDWTCFGRCLLDYGLRSRPEYADIVKIIESRVDADLILAVINQGLLNDPLFSMCYNEC